MKETQQKASLTQRHFFLFCLQEFPELHLTYPSANGNLGLFICMCASTNTYTFIPDVLVMGNSLKNMCPEKTQARICPESHSDVTQNSP